MRSRFARGPARSALALAGLLAALAAAPADAQEHHTYTVSLLGGVGGSIDESDPGLGNRALQLGFGLVLENKVLLTARAGAIDFDPQDALGRLRGASFEYVSVGGEYRYQELIYQSGLFIALGGYRLEGRLATPTGSVLEEETTLGVSAGVTGEFEISRRVGLQGEIVAHYVLSDFVEFYAQAMGGVAVHF